MAFQRPLTYIASVKPGSPADRAGVQAGEYLLAIDDQHLQDIIDLSFAAAEPVVTLTLGQADGAKRQVTVEKEIDEELGLVFDSAVFDKIRSCANQCLFCFVDQMAPGLRESLYVKDDDFRLSFLYGNFITLTNFTEHDLRRVVSMNLSPLYVSVHTTDPALRVKMLNHAGAGNILERLKTLTKAGIAVHTQIVLCPGFNDGEELARTFADLSAMAPQVLSMAIVPVGLTKFRDGLHPLRTFTPAEAAAIIDQVSAWQAACRKKLGQGFVYLGDEFYLRAGRPIPPADDYDGFPQLENGIGLVRSFLLDWQAAPEVSACPASRPPIAVLTGVSAATVLSPLVEAACQPGREQAVWPVVNRFFGEQITVTGLLTGRDIIDTVKLRKQNGKMGLILPGLALRNGTQLFLDGLSVQDVERETGCPVRIAYSARELKRLLTEWEVDK